MMRTAQFASLGLMLGFATLDTAIAQAPAENPSGMLSTVTNSVLQTGQDSRASRERYLAERRERMDRTEAWFSDLKRSAAEAGDSVQSEWRDFLKAADEKWEALKARTADAKDVAEDKWEELTRNLDDSTDDFEQSLRRARARWMPTQQEYLAQAKDRLDEFKDDLASLRARIGRGDAGRRDRSRAAADDLNRKWDALKANLADARSAAADKWDADKARIKDGLDDLQSKYDELVRDYPEDRADYQRRLDRVRAKVNARLREVEAQAADEDDTDHARWVATKQRLEKQRDALEEQREKISGAAGDQWENLKEKSEEIMSRARDALDDAGDRLEAAAASIKEKAKS